ncbi:MAG: hypothetical protein AAFO95_06170 [Cyanobacteria bacterium J06600_6]
MTNSIPNKLSTLFDPIVQEAVDEAIEQHRLNGHAISQSDENGNVIEIQPEDIIPLAEKLKQRQQQTSQVL